MDGKTFKEIINNTIGDNDIVAVIDKYQGADCLYELTEENIQKIKNNDNNIYVFTRNTIKQ